MMKGNEYSDEYRVLASETTLAIDDEPGTTVDEQAATSYNEGDDSQLTLFLVPIGGLSTQTRVVLSTVLTLFFYGASCVRATRHNSLGHPLASTASFFFFFFFEF